MPGGLCPAGEFVRWHASGADDRTPTRTPAVWMISLGYPNLPANTPSGADDAPASRSCSLFWFSVWVSTPSLSYLAPLKNLWSLDIKLGGIRCFAGIDGKTSIKYLELWQTRELRDVEILRDLPGLQNLFLQALPHITYLPPPARSTALRRVVLESLKSLHEFAALEQAPALEEFALTDGRKQNPEDLIPVLRNRAVRNVSAHFAAD